MLFSVIIINFLIINNQKETFSDQEMSSFLDLDLVEQISCRDYKKSLDLLNYIISLFHFGSEKDTSEGILKRSSVMYYPSITFLTKGFMALDYDCFHLSSIR